MSICILFPLAFSQEKEMLLCEALMNINVATEEGSSQQNVDIILLKILWFCCSLRTVEEGLSRIYGPEAGAMCLSDECEQRFSNEDGLNEEKGENELLRSAEIC